MCVYLVPMHCQEDGLSSQKTSQKAEECSCDVSWVLGSERLQNCNPTSPTITTNCLKGFLEKKPLLSSKNKLKHLQFARHWNCKWDRVLWLDETKT